jgi:hypothetical protein
MSLMPKGGPFGPSWKTCLVGTRYFNDNGRDLKPRGEAEYRPMHRHVELVEGKTAALRVVH